MKWNPQQEVKSNVILKIMLNIFQYTFDFEEWPTTHSDRKEYIRPYNGSIFEVRNKYREIFFEDRFEIPDENKAA